MQAITIKIISASVASTVVGVLAGYQYAKKKLSTEFDEIAQREIAEAREFFMTIRERETPQAAVQRLVPDAKVAEGVQTFRATNDLVEAAKEAHRSYQGTPVHVVKADAGQGLTATTETKEQEAERETQEAMAVDQEEGDPESTVIERNILFDGRPLEDSEWDPEAERDERRNGVPYVVSEGEYMENEHNHEQIVLTYFALSDTLVDEDEKPIDDVEGTCGTENLKRFGHGSGDINVVFVRNEKRGMDMEILRSMGSYEKEVLGIDVDDELQHAHMPRRGRRLEE